MVRYVLELASGWAFDRMCPVKVDVLDEDMDAYKQNLYVEMGF